MAGEKLARMIQESARKAANSNDKTDFIPGEVISTDPLKIKVDNKFVLDERFLLLSALCKRKALDLSSFENTIINLILDVVESADITYQDEEGEEQDCSIKVDRKVTLRLGEMILWDDLQRGEKVRMLRVSSGQLYYVLEREEENGTDHIRRV